METSNFISRAEVLDFVGGVKEKAIGTSIFFEKCLVVEDKEGAIISTVSIESELSIGTRFSSFARLTIHQKERLFDLLTEYAATPIELRRDETIEEKAREYMKECLSDNLNFYSCLDNLEYSRSEMRESEIYDWYRNNSNEFVKMWCEVAADE